MSGSAPQRLHVAQISFFNDPARRRPEQLLETWSTLVDVAEAASGAQVRASVIQACEHTEELVRNGVHYHFLPFGSGAAGNSGLGKLLRALRPDLFHVHGLNFHEDVRLLAALAPGVPIILQDHASRIPRPWRRSRWRRGLAAADAISFCAAAQAQPFREARLLPAAMPVYEIPESTTPFMPGERAAARAVTAIAGSPAVLWVGHLDANKDPLTVLDGVSRAARELPQLRLYCCFGVAPLLRAVEERVNSDEDLHGRVRLLGRVPHERVELLMRAADLFVLGSHREGSGYALIEALACGLAPVVTDIPSFRSLTAGGAVGRLWPCGDARALGEALVWIAPRADAGMRAAVRAHFEREISPEALRTKLAHMYFEVAARKRSEPPRRCAPSDA
ncbi:MAG: glycosyltransferase family 4 protein [Gammaproteobacteria bacterium]|nr:glycosyltransferase family 4 protein [Gammaproteobacteria bacterium]